MISILNQALPTWFAGAFFGAESAGWFQLARLTLAPAFLAGTTVGSVTSQRMAMLHRDHQPVDFIIRKTIMIMAASLPAFALLAILAPYWTGTVFGNSWQQAGTSIAMMAPVGFITVVYATIESVPILFRLNWFLVGWHVARLAILLFGFFLASKFSLSYLQWLTYYASSEFLLYALYCATSLRLGQNVTKIG
jgi:O-antigen/teichoic acid export membrane protein